MDVISRGPQDIRLARPRDGQIVSLGDVLGTLYRDVLRISWDQYLPSGLGRLLKTGMSLMGNVLKLLAKSVLLPVGLTAAVSATDAAIYQEMFASGWAAKVFDRTRPLDLASRTTLIISNEEMNDIIK